LSLSPTPLSP